MRFLLLSAAVLLAGCATMLNKGNASMTLQSEPSGATVVVNGTERGTTPFTYNYIPDDGEIVSLEVRKSGYQARTIRLKASESAAVLFADAMLLHLPYLADRRSPALYTLPVKEHTVRLPKEMPSDLTRFMMPTSGFDVDPAAMGRQGTLNGKSIRTGKDGLLRELQWPDQLASGISSALRDSWMDAAVVRMGTKKGDEAIQRAKIHLRPRITGIQATLRGSSRAIQGPITLSIAWRFLSNAPEDSVLFTVEKAYTYDALGESANEVISTALRDATHELLATDGLYDRVAAWYGNRLNRSKGVQISLPKPRPIAYNGRKEMLSALVKAVVTVQRDKGHGSGFVITNDGYIITNEHVVGDASLMKVRFEQGFTLDAQVVKVNKDFDLALLKVQASDLPALTAGDDKALLLGEELFAIGTPVDAQLGQSVARGILSGRRELDGRSYLQSDVSINPGNSGGPLVDEKGTVVGVTTMKINGKGLEGLGFAVPISVAMEMLNIQFAQ